MRLSSKILLTYLFGLLFSVLNTWLFSNTYSALQFYKTAIFWIGPLIFISVGLTIGTLLLIVVKRRDRLKFIFRSALAGCLLFCAITLTFRFGSWYRSRYLANIEHNEDFLNSMADYPPQERHAFNLLVAKYKNANDIFLTEKSVSKYDSTVNNQIVKAYNIEFVYQKNSAPGYFKSNCTIIGNEGSFKYFDQQLDLAEQHSLDSSKNKSIREALEKILKDSARVSIDTTNEEDIRTKK